MRSNDMNTIVGRYGVLECIGKGAFGSVYKGIDKRTTKIVAIKTEPLDSEVNIIQREASILKYLYDYGCKRVPLIEWYGPHSLCRCLIMTYYEGSITQYIMQDRVTSRKCDKIMYRLLHIINEIHSAYVLHRDLKPDNFMIKNNDIYLIDFGLATFYIDDEKMHISNRSSNNTIIGSPNFTSYHVFDGNTHSRRDDLISLGYIYLYMCSGYLPWDSKNLTEYIQCANTDLTSANHSRTDELFLDHPNNVARKEMKSLELIEDICTEVNPRLYEYMEECYSMIYTATPDYTLFMGLFEPM